MTTGIMRLWIGQYANGRWFAQQPSGHHFEGDTREEAIEAFRKASVEQYETREIVRIDETVIRLDVPVAEETGEK